MTRVIVIALLGLLAVALRAEAQMPLLNVGPGSAAGSAGGGGFVPSFLLIDVGSIMLIQTGSKIEIHS